MNRIITRILLVVAFITSVIVAMIALISGGSNSWATVAAALAVITSVISSWSAQRVLELQEDTQKPSVLPTIDNKNRVGLFLFRVKNFGGSPAYDICINWDIPLLNREGNPITFNLRNKGEPDINVLLPHESLATLIDAGHNFLKNHGKTDVYTGTLRYKDASGKEFRHSFCISATQLSNTQTKDSEVPEGFRKLQEIPDSINNLTKEVIHLRQFLQMPSAKDGNS